MKFSLIPREEVFFTLFQSQAKLVVQSAELLVRIIDSYPNNSALLKELDGLEHKGDDLVHKISVRLHRTFVTPIDREDIHALAGCLDDIIDLAHGAAHLMRSFKVEQTKEPCRQQAEVILKSAGVIHQGIERLPQFTDIGELKAEIIRLEREGDRIHRSAIADLFNGNEPPLEVIKWKEIYESLESAADRCEDVFDVLEGIFVKHS